MWSIPTRENNIRKLCWKYINRSGKNRHHRFLSSPFTTSPSNWNFQKLTHYLLMFFGSRTIAAHVNQNKKQKKKSLVSTFSWPAWNISVRTVFYICDQVLEILINWRKKIEKKVNNKKERVKLNEGDLYHWHVGKRGNIN